MTEADFFGQQVPVFLFRNVWNGSHVMLEYSNQ